MPALARRRSPDHRQECWEIYYGDVHAGTIMERTGNPHDAEPWEWRCGFYPGSRPGPRRIFRWSWLRESLAELGLKAKSK